MLFAQKKERNMLIGHRLMLNNWVEEWDNRIATWIEQGSECDMGLAHVRDAYQGKGQTALQFYALPEPYVGDPVSDDPLDAVLLMLNPGGSGPEQRRPNGKLVKEVQENSYHSVAKDYLLPRTRKWWLGRSRWPARLLEPSGGYCRIIGIDLIPWHSKKWGSIEISEEVLIWFKKNVLTPAAIMSKKSKLSENSKIGPPIVLAIGSQHAHYLPKLGFELKYEVNEKSDRSDLPEWPVQGDGLRVKRNIRLFVAEDQSLAVLQTDARGGFFPPSKAFDPIVRTMLALPMGKK
jgi:hypothetical protein